MLAPHRAFARSFFRPGPLADVFTSNAGFQIQLELPGVKKEDISITFEKTRLSVTAEKKQAAPESAKQLHAERTFGLVTRTFRLPSSAQVEKLDAVLANGVLTLSIPKNEKAKIDIKVQ